MQQAQGAIDAAQGKVATSQASGVFFAGGKAVLIPKGPTKSTYPSTSAAAFASAPLATSLMTSSVTASSSGVLCSSPMTATPPASAVPNTAERNSARLVINTDRKSVV